MSGTMGIIVWPMAWTRIMASDVVLPQDTGIRDEAGRDVVSLNTKGEGMTELKGNAVRLVCFFSILRVASFVAY